MSIILAKATGVGDSDEFEVHPGLPVTIAAYPSANMGLDVGTLKLKNPDDTFDPVYKNDVIVTVKATNPSIVVSGLGIFRVEFPTRAAAIGLTKRLYRRNFV